jgi:hypothetical protein
MRLKLKIEGFQKAIVDAIVERGIAKNRNEAIEKVILHYNDCFNIRPKR